MWWNVLDLVMSVCECVYVWSATGDVNFGGDEENIHYLQLWTKLLAPPQNQNQS